MNRSYAERRRFRYHKGVRRIREDRAEHGSDRRCPCFDPDGRTFARFADYPATWSWGGKVRKLFGPSPQERRGPRIEDWEPNP